MVNINYIFHLGERCQHLEFLKKNNILSGLNPLSGIYVSFEVSLKLIHNNFTDFTNNIAQFIISQKEKDNNIQFIRCYDFNEDELQNRKKLIKNNKFLFFNGENFYKNYNYCINLKYTNIDNLLLNDLYDYKNNYCICPNNDFTSETTLETIKRRTNRFVDCIQNNTNNTLFIYINKSIIDIECYDKINYISHIYDLAISLFYVLPVYCEDNNPKINEKIVVKNNITFYIIYFPPNSYQSKYNPTDDNNLSNIEQYNKIYKTIIETYNINLISLY